MQVRHIAYKKVEILVSKAIKLCSFERQFLPSFCAKLNQDTKKQNKKL